MEKKKEENFSQNKIPEEKDHIKDYQCQMYNKIAETGMSVLSLHLKSRFRP